MRVLQLSTTLAELQTNWTSLGHEEKKLPTVLALKEQLKTKLS